MTNDVFILPSVRFHDFFNQQIKTLSVPRQQMLKSVLVTFMSHYPHHSSCKLESSKSNVLVCPSDKDLNDAHQLWIDFKKFSIELIKYTDRKRLVERSVYCPLDQSPTSSFYCYSAATWLFKMSEWTLEESGHGWIERKYLAIPYRYDLVDKETLPFKLAHLNSYLQNSHFKEETKKEAFSTFLVISFASAYFALTKFREIREMLPSSQGIDREKRSAFQLGALATASALFFGTLSLQIAN